MAKNSVKISLLGDFMLTEGKTKITNYDLSNQLAILISFLAMNHGKSVSADEISEILWPDGIANSSGALKNLVYRLRKVLEDKKFAYAREIVIPFKGSYKLNPRLEYSIDAELFMQNYKKSLAETISDTKKEKVLAQVVKYYRGGFMQELPSQEWISSVGRSYHKMYFSACYELLEIYKNTLRFEEMLELAKSAVQIDRFEETAHRYVMLGLYKTGLSKQALNYYKQTRETFYRELGVELSGETREFYNEISKSSKITNVDIVGLKEEFKEDARTAKDTFYCELEVFKQLYRFNARTLSRTGASFFMGLLTVDGVESNDLEPKIREKAMDQLRQSIQTSLRRGDVFSLCSPSQYVIMLPSVTLENTVEILDRINRHFKSQYHSRKVTIFSSVQPIEPSDY